MQDLVDQLLGNRYQLVQFLGSGGMGSVYRAMDSTLQRDVAIKVLHAGLAQNQESQERFRQEARIAARLRHPNIVGVHDFGQDGDIFYIAMELILGDNLRQMMNKMRRQRQWIVLSEAIQLIRELALALDYAHKQSVLHRDIKPANIMIKDETVADLAYQPVITDLGLAKLGGSGFQTRVGSTMGTPAYMSPEQTMGKEVDERSDIYSLGVLLYELAAAQLPFPAKNLTEAIRYHRQEKPPPLSRFRPDMPDAVEQIIMKALAKEPNQRFGSAGELARALASLAADTYLKTVPPIAIAGASSFKTYYQHSRIELADDAVRDRPMGAISEVDQIEIVGPTKEKQQIDIRAQRLTLGRHTRNEIVLADQAVSRHHAQIEFDGERYLITDLGSANGTYLAHTRLHPNSPTPWQVDEPVRIGNHYLILRRHTARQGADTTPHRAPQPAQSSPSPGNERAAIRVGLSTSAETVAPGGNIRVEITVSNRSDEDMDVHAEIEGLPLAWVSTPSIDLVLANRERQSVIIYVRPPKAVHTRPGRYTLTAVVYRSGSAETLATASTMFHVQSFINFNSKVEPAGAQRQKSYAVTVQNQGNAAQPFTITCKQERNSVIFQPDHFVMQLSPGQSEMLTVQVQVRRPWIGKGQHPIQIEIRPPEGTVQTHSAQVNVQPLLPRPAVLILVLLAIGIMGGIWLVREAGIWPLLP